MAASNIRTTPLPLQCKECGASYERVGRMAREYCSEECRLTRKRRLRGKGIVPKCELCGEEFVRNSSRQKFCMDCRDAARKDYSEGYSAENVLIIRDVAKAGAAKRRERDPERVRELDRKWKAAHWDEILESRKTPKERERSRNYLKRRYLEVPEISISRRISTGIYQSINGKKGGRKWETLVGYTLSELMAHLERQFRPGMSWDNRSDWHIDHIRPLSSFCFSSVDDEEFKAAWALTNLRPLWAHDNLSKGAKVLTLV